MRFSRHACAWIFNRNAACIADLRPSISFLVWRALFGKDTRGDSVATAVIVRYLREQVVLEAQFARFKEELMRAADADCGDIFQEDVLGKALRKESRSSSTAANDHPIARSGRRRVRKPTAAGRPRPPRAAVAAPYRRISSSVGFSSRFRPSLGGTTPLRKFSGDGAWYCGLSDEPTFRLLLMSVACTGQLPLFKHVT
ncbi:uncharacterized protein LOC144100192 isoform X2 [Amblyomma americanum]